MFQKNFYRFLNILVVISMTLVGVAVVHATEQPAVTAASSLTITPIADAYVIATYPDTNFGTTSNLRVDGSPITRSYLRFTVSGIGSGTVSSAILRIYANSANTTGYSVHSEANNTWTETGITYNNSPAVGAVIKSSTAISAGTWVSVDVTSYIKADGTYDMVLDTSNTTNTSLGAREIRRQRSATGDQSERNGTHGNPNDQTRLHCDPGLHVHTRVNGNPWRIIRDDFQAGGQLVYHVDLPNHQLWHTKQLPGGQFPRHPQLPAFYSERHWQWNRVIGDPAYLRQQRQYQWFFRAFRGG